MKKLLSVSVGIALAASSGAAFVHAQTLPREDNIWGGHAHQPTQSEVTQREQSAGIAASPGERHSADAEVESLFQNLMHESAPMPG